MIRNTLDGRSRARPGLSGKVAVRAEGCPSFSLPSRSTPCWAVPKSCRTWPHRSTAAFSRRADQIPIACLRTAVQAHRARGGPASAFHVTDLPVGADQSPLSICLLFRLDAAKLSHKAVPIRDKAACGGGSEHTNHPAYGGAGPAVQRLGTLSCRCGSLDRRKQARD